MGKKSNSGKKGKKGKKTVSKNIPQLPVELFAVITEFLIGDLAFGTAANLNVVSKAVRSETLPILYETVTVMPRALSAYFGEYGEELPVALKFTKYLFTANGDDKDQAYQTHMPRLVMVISTKSLSAEPEAFDLHLLKSISSTTAAVILGTLVRHQPLDHSKCNPNARSNHKLSAACRLTPHANFRPINLINQLHLDGGNIIPTAEHPLENRSPPLVALGLHDTVIDLGSGCCDSCGRGQNAAETVVELMKLGCKRSDPEGLRKVEKQLLKDRGDMENGLPYCLVKPRHTEWHLSMTGGPRSVERFIKKLSEEVIHVPELLQYRILVHFGSQLIPKDAYEYLRAYMSKVYSDNISHARQVLPSTANAPTIMQMDATLRMPMPGMSQQQRRDVPTEAPPLPDFFNMNVTGSCIAYLRNGGVYIHSTTGVRETPGLTLQPDPDNPNEMRVDMSFRHVLNRERTTGGLELPLWQTMENE